MTIVEALKNIYNKWTGKTSEGNTIEEVLGELNADYTPGSGGGDTYETVDEIEIGEMSLDDPTSLYTYSYTGEAPAVTGTDEVRIRLDDGPEYDATVFIGDGGVVSIMYNFDIEEGATGTPAYGVVCNSGACSVFSDTDLSNTTIRILKKVSGGGGSDNDYVVNGTINQSDMTITLEDDDLSSIATAAASGKNVRLIARTNDGDETIVVFADYAFGFSDDYVLFSGAFLLGEDGNVPAFIYGNNSYGSETLHVDMVPRVPSITAGDVGKSLKVIIEDGAPKYVLADNKDPLFVHGTIDPLSAHTAEITDNISLADIYNAAAAGRYVAFEGPMGTGNTTRIPLAGYTREEGENGPEYGLAFSVSSSNPFDHTKVAVFAVNFENSKTGTANIISDSNA